MLVGFWTFISWQQQDDQRSVTVYTDGKFVALRHWETSQP